MEKTAVTGSPGFISIAVSDVNRSASFYEQHLGAVRDTFDFGADAVAFVGWPTFALSSARRPGQSGPSPDTTSIQLWWRASDAQALYERVVSAGVRIIGTRRVPESEGREQHLCACKGARRACRDEIVRTSGGRGADRTRDGVDRSPQAPRLRRGDEGPGADRCLHDDRHFAEGRDRGV